MLILENLDNNRKLSLSDNDLDLIYDALSELQDNDDCRDQVLDLQDKFYTLFSK
jgi:hypothetical protein